MSCSRTQHGGGRSRTPDLSLRSPTLYHWATALPFHMCDKYLRILHTCDRFVKYVERPEFGLVLARLDIMASLIDKFHSNSPSTFWEDAITRKIKMATRHWGEYSDQDLKKDPTSGLGGDAITNLSMGNFIKSELVIKRPHLSTDGLNFFLYYN